MLIQSPSFPISHFDELLQEVGLEPVDTISGEGLHYVEGKLSYGPVGGKKSDLVSFDLEKEWNSHRGKNYSLKKEPLAKALGIKGDGSTTVIDSTCGTGKDSILLLKFGARVISYERNQVVAALFFDALMRVHAKGGELADILRDRFEFHYLDSSCIAPTSVDGIYIDPMYPSKKKKALPRKEMQIFKSVVGSDSDAGKLLTWAKSFDCKRIVVKRPLHGEFLSGTPTHSFEGKSTRYDLY